MAFQRFEIFKIRMHLLSKSFLLTIFFLLSFIVNSQPVAAPDLRCATVNPNGDVVLSWIKPSDPGNNFLSYEIYRANALTGPYTFLISINSYNQTSYVHPNASPCPGTIFYYIKTRYNSNPDPLLSDSSNVIQTMAVTLTVPVPYNGTVVLNWNAMSQTPLLTHNPYYKIYMEYPAGVWRLVDSTAARTYRDTIDICDAFLNYRVEQRDASGCSSFSCKEGAQLTDITPPHKVYIDSLSYDTTTGQVRMTWQKSYSTDVIGCVILKNDPNFAFPWVAVDTAFGYLNTNILIDSSYADSIPYTYTLFCVDSCGNSSIFAEPQRTMWLETVFDRCDKSVRLRWNKYRGWLTGTEQYNIYQSINGGNYNLITSVPSTDSVFQINNLLPELDYCFYIRAKQRNKSVYSRSNPSCIFTGYPEQPDFMYIVTVSVTDNNTVDLIAITDSTSGVFKYRLERLTNSETNYQKVADIFREDIVGNFIYYNDAQTDASKNYYKYRLIGVDSCNLDYSTSNIAKTIFLQGTNNLAEFYNELNWNKYGDWEGRLVRQDVLRSVNGVFEAEPATILFDTIFTYTDIVNQLPEANGEFCYVIQAYEGPTLGFNFRAKSRSNKVCLTQNSVLFIPNAFTPYGFNPTFGPKFSFLNYSNYRFEIFDRLGAKIFSTNNPTDVWDGKMPDGSIAKESVYVYTLQYANEEDKIFQRQGTVTIIR